MATSVPGNFPATYYPPPVARIGTFRSSHFPTRDRNSVGKRNATNKKPRLRCSKSGVQSETEAVEIEIESVARNTRRIEARVGVEARLEAVWAVLTDYEALSDFIPGLAQSRVLIKSPNYARLFQVGEQNLGLGIKFNAEGVIDCFERDLQISPAGALSRDIDFEMVEGDFEVFRGKWSILQETSSLSSALSYTLSVKPKLWLPVRLVEGILCNEIRINLASIRRRTLLIT